MVRHLHTVQKETFFTIVFDEICSCSWSDMVLILPWRHISIPNEFSEHVVGFRFLILALIRCGVLSQDQGDSYYESPCSGLIVGNCISVICFFKARQSYSHTPELWVNVHAFDRPSTVQAPNFIGICLHFFAHNRHVIIIFHFFFNCYSNTTWMRNNTKTYLTHIHMLWTSTLLHWLVQFDTL